MLVRKWTFKGRSQFIPRKTFFLDQKKSFFFFARSPSSEGVMSSDLDMNRALLSILEIWCEFWEILRGFLEFWYFKGPSVKILGQKHQIVRILINFWNENQVNSSQKSCIWSRNVSFDIANDLGDSKS